MPAGWTSTPSANATSAPSSSRPPCARPGGTRCCKSARRSSFTKGRIIVRGKLVTRGQAKRADYILYYKPNIPLALIEAKDNSHSVGDGMQQGLDYATTLDIPFVFSSNGDGFVFHDRTGASNPREANLALDAFPSPADLWARYRAWKGLTREAEQIVAAGLLRRRQRQGAALLSGQRRQRRDRGHRQGPGPRPAGHGDRHGQDLHRLPDHLAAVEGGRKKRILYLADRNVLIDQTMVNDFRPFGGAMAKLRPSEDHRARRRHRSISPPRSTAPAHRHRLRNLSRPVPGDHRAGGAAEALPRVFARLLRPDRDRRMPPRQRGRGFGVAGNPRIFLRRQRRSA